MIALLESISVIMPLQDKLTASIIEWAKVAKCSSVLVKYKACILF